MLTEVLDILLPVIFLALLVGSVALWRKTRRGAVLLQLVPCALTFCLILVGSVAHCLSRFDRWELIEAIHRPSVVTATLGLFILSFAAFSVGYVWYALTRERI